MNIYNKKFTLELDEYLSSIIKEMDISSGVTCIVASVGSGKTTDFVNKPDTYIAAPLISIKQSEIDKGAMNILTWQALVLKVHGSHDKSEFASKTLVVDEAHGLFMDYSYKASAIRDLISVFPFFKSVVIMSGSLNPEHINSFHIDRSYSVYKPQSAMKVLDTYVYEKNGLAAFEAFLHARKGVRKTIALVNDKVVCNQIAQRYGDSALVVNADEKANDDVLKLYATRKMGEKWDLILGTNSIREGLSIEDQLEEVDVVIYGHTDPDVIEQFSNRFRNVTGVKHVHYFIPKSKFIEIADFDISGFTGSAQRFADMVNEFYMSSDNDEQYKEYLRSTYHAEAKGSHLRYKKETDSFLVDLISVDAEYYEHRRKQVQYDPVLFEANIIKYDFNVNPSRLVSGDDSVAELLKEGKKAVKDKQKEDREERLISITQSFQSGVFHHTGDQEYDYVVDSINKLITKGLTKEQIKLVVDGVIEDKNFIRRVWSDFNYVELDTNIRNQILRYIAVECPDDELNPFDTYLLANLALTHTLDEFFRGDEKEMRKNKEWGKLVEWRGGRLEVKGNCEVRVINKYITLGERKRVRVNKDTPVMLKGLLDICKVDTYSSYPVKYTNLTGFTIEQTQQTEEFNKKADARVNEIRSRFMALRAA
ncbi:hypothetical protein [Pantoea ananatis]|uniref:hypothetical protein n=1 Tax=Pantoea ananas TaxID=553 RepID=UPI0018902EEA|nr:hypothetical protein [Pantoea ananatis]